MVALGGELRVGPLVVALRVLESDRERLHRAIQQLSHEADDRARVDPSAEERTERNVGDQAPLNRLPKKSAHLAGRLVERDIEPFSSVCAGNNGLPIALDDRLTAGLEGHHVPWRKAHDAFEETARGRHVAERKERRDCGLIEPPWYPWVSEHGLDLAGEHERAARGPVEERLLSNTVAPDHETSVPVVPDRERKHAVEAARELNWR